MPGERRKKFINVLKLTETEAFAVTHSHRDIPPDQPMGGYREKGSVVWAKVWPDGQWHKTTHKSVKRAMDDVLGAITAQEAISLLLLQQRKPSRYHEPVLLSTEA